MSGINWQGVFPAVTTQFREDQSLDLAASAAHFEALIDSGISGLVVCGSLGENQSMTPDEKRSVVKAAIQTGRGRVPIVSGVAESSTEAAIRYVRDCQQLGIDGFMVMPPMVYRPDERETQAYFRTVAGATDLPWMLYNNPVGYTVDVTPQMLVRYADIGNLRAIKESSANPRRVTELHNTIGDRLAIFVGVDDLLLEAAILGIDGWVAGTGIAFPAENQHLWDLTRAGRWDEARAIYRWFQPLLKLDTYPKFVQYIKLCVQETGLGAQWVRAPRLVIEGAEREQVMAIIGEGIARRPRIGAAATGAASGK